MIIKLEDIAFSYGSKLALTVGNATFSPGLTGVLGTNGAGKSTLMRVLAGVAAPSSGHMTVDGADVYQHSNALIEYRRLLGWVPQEAGIPDHLTVKEFLLYAAWLKAISKRATNGVIQQVLEQTQLTFAEHGQVRKLSGGQKRRVCLAAALVGNPRCVILDEPTVGLDPTQRDNFNNVIAEIAKNCTVLFSTHILEDVYENADNICLLRDGNLAAIGPAQPYWSDGNGNPSLAEFKARLFGTVNAKS